MAVWEAKPTTATRNAAFKFPHASQQARFVKKGNHLYMIVPALKKIIKQKLKI